MSRLRTLYAAALVVASAASVGVAARAYERAENADARATEQAAVVRSAHSEELAAAVAAARVAELEARYTLLDESIDADRRRLQAAVEQADRLLPARGDQR